MSRTGEAEKIIRIVARERGYRMIENKRLLLSRKPKLFYQPDFLLIGEKGSVVIEIELTTDARKQLVGDIVRAGLINATYFIGITNSEGSKKAVETYGEALRKGIKEISPMRVWGVFFKNKKELKNVLKKLL